MLPIATYKYTTTNIGDDVQPYAIEQLIGRRTEKLYRDHLYRHRRPVALIGNSWYFVSSPLSRVEAFLRNGRMFPPHRNVKPLYIGVSISRRAERDMLSPQGVEHLRRHGPVGARDVHTLELLKSRGIDAYFSGCPTMTLENRHGRRDGAIYLVDTDRRRRAGGMLRGLTANPVKGEDFTPLVPAAIRRKAITLSHFVDFGDDQARRHDYVEKLIEAYSTARLVVTTRLHVALPCAALGTPCVLLRRPDFRFTGYDFLKTYSPETIGECDWNPDTLGIPDIDAMKTRMRETILGWLENGQRFAHEALDGDATRWPVGIVTANS